MSANTLLGAPSSPVFLASTSTQENRIDGSCKHVLLLVGFLEKLGELRSLTPLAPSMARHMDKAYNLDAAKNCEIRCAWYKLAIDAGDEGMYPGVVDMLSSQGRMKYLRPLYRALPKSISGRPVALETFQAVSGRYHPIAKKMVAADLQLRQ